MMEEKNETKDMRFYSQRAIAMATLIGGPLAAGYMIRENYLSLKKPDEGKKSLIIGIISSVVIFGGILMIPETIINRVPNILIPTIYTGIIYLIVEKIHGKILNQHKEFKNEFFAGWQAVGIGLASLVVILFGFLGYEFLSPERAKYELYNVEYDKFSKNETETLVFYDYLNTETNSFLLQELDNKIIPKWKKNIEIIKQSNQIENLPTELLEQNVILLKYSKLRINAFELFKKAIIEDTDKYNEELEEIHLKIEEQIENLNIP